MGRIRCLKEEAVRPFFIQSSMPVVEASVPMMVVPRIAAITKSITRITAIPITWITAVTHPITRITAKAHPIAWHPKAHSVTHASEKLPFHIHFSLLLKFIQNIICFIGLAGMVICPCSEGILVIPNLKGEDLFYKIGLQCHNKENLEGGKVSIWNQQIANINLFKINLNFVTSDKRLSCLGFFVMLFMECWQLEGNLLD